MREIKFRAWDEQAKLMHEDFRYIKSGNEGDNWIIFTSARQTLQEKQHPFENPYFQEQFKIMQYTGLKDANGVEIYEGDIVEYLCGFTEETSNHQVKYFCEDDYPAFDFSPSISDDMNGFSALVYQEIGTVKVIGNIYQNQELLNG